MAPEQAALKKCETPSERDKDDHGQEVLTVIWLGRRQIHGIAPGRTIQIEGRIGVQHGQRVMFNPRYELCP